MEEILRTLGDEDRVLDLGGGRGSLPDSLQARAVILDIERPAGTPSHSFVQGDAAALPFRPEVFRAVVSNHSLEHIEGLDACLAEMGRVTAEGGSLFVSVPDSRTVSDKIYRWLGRGGGHVNPFPDDRALAARIERSTGLPHHATRLLYTGYSILNAKNQAGRRQLKLWLFAGGHETFVRWLTLLCRLLDRLLGTRLSVYGWAFYFGPKVPVEASSQTNVCIRCGAGASESWITANCRISAFFGLRRYACARCGTLNFLTADSPAP